MNGFLFIHVILQTELHCQNSYILFCKRVMVYKALVTYKGLLISLQCPFSYKFHHGCDNIYIFFTDWRFLTLQCKLQCMLLLYPAQHKQTEGIGNIVLKISITWWKFKANTFRLPYLYRINSEYLSDLIHLVKLVRSWQQDKYSLMSFRSTTMEPF